MPRTGQANQRIREETREKVLDAARKVFARKGTGATMSEVAKEAGMSQGLAYRYFPSKEAILTALVKQMAASGGGAAAKVEAIPGTPIERLGLLVSSVLQRRREQPEFYQLVYHVMNDDKAPRDLRRTMNESGRELRAAIRRLVVEGQAAGEVAGDDPDQLVGALLACLDGLSRRMLTLTPEEARRSIPDAKVVVRMLRPDKEA